ncbi:hypothetical protein F7725_001293 [Dissostichus mawsoni]|uniref:Uncharacterized protein n=1 Tax=Dissostichus mawsoni TaxID=36200 RepID=A0A7J5ZKZ6_DISMA|nr:hypothetical protein F7725_001293 [Dissostichus mawsoni]
MKIEKCPHVSPCLCVLQEKQTEMEGLKQQLQEVEKQKEEHNAAMEKLKQLWVVRLCSLLPAGDKGHCGRAEDLEKKGSAAVSLEELVLSEINSPSRSQPTGDSSSVSSFSYRDMMKESQPTNQNKSGGGSPQSQRPAELSDDEVGELFQRLAEVKHLEVSCSSMAEDICRKSSIIETYVMDSRIESVPPQHVVYLNMTLRYDHFNPPPQLPPHSFTWTKLPQKQHHVINDANMELWFLSRRSEPRREKQRGGGSLVKLQNNSEHSMWPKVYGQIIRLPVG